MSFFQRSSEVTPEMAHQLIQELQKNGIQYIVAPYEADAQLAYLEKMGIVDAVLTEDSDLIVYGCNRVIFKMQNDGTAEEYQRERLPYIDSIDMDGLTFEQFRRICIFSGCDYLKSIPGIGLKTSYKYFKQYKTVENIVSVLRGKHGNSLDDYVENFRKAELTFQHQVVYDPKQKKTVYFSSFERDENIKDYTFLGSILLDEDAELIAKGLIHPCTKLSFKAEVSKQSEERITIKSLKRKREKTLNFEKNQTTITSFLSEIIKKRDTKSEIPESHLTKKADSTFVYSKDIPKTSTKIETPFKSFLQNFKFSQ